MEKDLKTKNDTKYAALIQSIGELLSSARAKIATNVDTVMVQTYWSVGKYIVEFEQDGNEHAEYGSKLLHNLSRDLTLRYGKGFSHTNINKMRKLFTTFPILQTLSAKLSWNMLRRDWKTLCL